MRLDRFRQSLWTIAVATIVPTVSAAQDATPTTPWGDPDLNGTWDFSIATPLERPDELGDQTHFSVEEAQAFLDDTEGRLEELVRGLEGDDFVGVEIWVDTETATLTRDLRTSLIVQPADGKIPELTEQAKARQELEFARFARPPEGPEDRNLWERCILASGPPLFQFVNYNSNVQIFQTPHTVAIMAEMINDTRIIPLDGRSHLPAGIRQWKGDSRGRWEGKTLVVETQNFTRKSTFNGSGMNMLLTERFTRVSDTQIDYAYTIVDADSFSEPWSVAQSLRKLNEPIYEYACHEGNISMELMLSGARTLERGQFANEAGE